MATVGQPIRGRKPPSYARKVVVRVSAGRAIIQAWPKKRGRPRNPVTIEQNLKFREANILAKYAPSDDQWMAIEVTKNSPWYPRDLLMSAMFGRLFETITVDGKRMVSMAVIEDISSDLDLLGSNMQGSVLIRTETLWTGLPPGTVGQVLTSGGPDANPTWAGAAGGGGGYIVSNVPDFVPNAALFATKGSKYRISRAVTVTAMACMLTAVVGHTYRGRIWSLDGASNTVALVGDTGAVTGLAAGRQTVWTGLLTPAVLAAGTRYFMAWSRTDGPNNFAMPIHWGNINNPLNGLPVETYAFSANKTDYTHLALANPPIPTLIPVTGNGIYSIPLALQV